MPAIVGLVASNFGRPSVPAPTGWCRRPARSPLRWAADRWAVHDIRLVAVGLRRRGASSLRHPAVHPALNDTPPSRAQARPGRHRAVRAGPGLIVFGVLRSGSGVRAAQDGAPEWLGLSPVIWLILGGAVVLDLFLRWETCDGRGRGRADRPRLLRNVQCAAGSSCSSSCSWCRPACSSPSRSSCRSRWGCRRSRPASGSCRCRSRCSSSPWASRSCYRTPSRRGSSCRVPAAVRRAGPAGRRLEEGAGAEIITGPLLLAGLGIGALASQLGSVTVSAVPDEQSGEVGGLQNTGTNLGASIGTALAGAILISALTASSSPASRRTRPIPTSSRRRPDRARQRHALRLRRRPGGGAARCRRVTTTRRAVLDENAEARIAACVPPCRCWPSWAILALLFTGGVPTVQPGAAAQANAPPIEAPVAPYERYLIASLVWLRLFGSARRRHGWTWNAASAVAWEKVPLGSNA